MVSISSIYKPGRPAKYTPETGQGKCPPRAPGEYRIRNKDGILTYVGETGNLYVRLEQHQRYGKLSNGQNAGGSFEWKQADRRSSSATRRVHERAKIAQHKPPMNGSCGGEGRPCKKK
ncbi:MAG: GIY-YIG nuclease family protein [Lachnospiraceae bacterium]|nr:GIY-YIG nuclease family protein [Lachnospiraceae bacterium]